MTEQTPDLASILRTLASLQSQNQQTQVETTTQLPSTAQTPVEVQPYQPELQNYQIAPQVWPKPEEIIPSRSTTPPGLPKNHVDPATIIDWSSGLRCVMKVVGKNENIVEEIKRVRHVLRCEILRILMFFRWSRSRMNMKSNGSRVERF